MDPGILGKGRLIGMATSRYQRPDNPLKSALMLALPGIVTIVALIIDPPTGALVGCLAAMVAVACYPLSVAPLLIVAAAFQLITSFADIQFGWMIIVGATVGCGLLLLRREGRLVVDLEFILLFFLFLFLGLLAAQFDMRGRLDRLFTLLLLLLTLAVLSDFFKKLALRHPNRTTVHVAILIGGLLVLAYMLAMLSAGQLSLSRGTELSLTFGEEESSPSNISRMLAYALVVAVLLSLSGRDFTRSMRLLLVALAILYCIGLTYAGSRMPLIAAAVAISSGIFLQIWFGRGQIRRRTLVPLLMVMCCAVLFLAVISSGDTFTVPFFSDREIALRIARAPEVEGNIRLQYWQSHFSQLSLAQWIFGSGVGVLGNPHSVWVGCLATFGLLGLSALAALFLGAIRKGFRARSPIGIALLIYLSFAYASSSDVDRNQFWILLALAIALTAQDWSRLKETGSHG